MFGYTYNTYLSHTAQKTMDLKTPNNGEYSNSISDLPNPENGETLYSHEPQYFSEDIDSNCSTPYVSAPSSPGRGNGVGFFYSAPASPMHFVATFSSSKSAVTSPSRDVSVSGSFEFEFSARFASNGPSAAVGSMSSADELFLNGQIRPMKLSTHLQRPQNLAPLLDLEVEEEEFDGNNDRGRDLRLRNKSLRRRTRSLSPLRNVPFPWRDDEEDNREDKKSEIGLDLEDDESSNKIEMASTETPSVSASSSRSSSAGRNSKRWVFLKDFLYRSKIEGRSSSGKFWENLDSWLQVCKQTCF